MITSTTFALRYGSSKVLVAKQPPTSKDTNTSLILDHLHAPMITKHPRYNLENNVIDGPDNNRILRRVFCLPWTLL